MGDGKKQSQRGLLDSFRQAPIPMARSQDELFSLLAFYNPVEGWPAFAKRIDFADVTPGQICQVVLGRSSDSVEGAIGYDGYDPAAHLHKMLLCDEFRRQVQSVFLQAHAAKGRDVFIHIPKCAGTDLILNLGRKSVPLPKMMEFPDWVDDAGFVEILAGLARAAMSSDRLFAYGHMELSEYANRPGIRAHDRIFTVLRDPIELLISQANYAVGRLRQDPLGQDPDTAGYLRHLGVERLPEEMGPGDLKDLTIRVLLNPAIAEPNRACFYLGEEHQCRYSAAIKNLVIHNVEISTTEYYNRWLKERWGVAESARHNSSEPIISNTEARRICGAALAASTIEDQKLFDVVSWALGNIGASSITGPALARLIGAPLINAMSRNQIPDLPGQTRDKPAPVNMLVVQERKHVEMYLVPVSADIAGNSGPDVVIASEFGVGGDGARYRLDGWARPETAFTWTAAHECQIQLPPLTGDGNFVFRMICGPFVSKGKLPAQHIELLVDGDLLGVCDIRVFSLLECPLPGRVLTNDQGVTITLRLPTAARPREVSGADDDRLLALAVSSIAVLRVTPCAGI